MTHFEIFKKPIYLVFVAILLGSLMLTACGDSGRQELLAGGADGPGGGKKPSKKAKSENSTYGHAVLALGQLAEVHRVFQLGQREWPKDFDCLMPPVEEELSETHLRLTFDWDCRAWEKGSFGRRGVEDIEVTHTDSSLQKIERPESSKPNHLLYNQGSGEGEIDYQGSVRIFKIDGSHEDERVFRFVQKAYVEGDGINVAVAPKESSDSSLSKGSGTVVKPEEQASPKKKDENEKTSPQQRWEATTQGQIHIPKEGPIYLTQIQVRLSYDMEAMKSSGKSKSTVSDILHLESTGAVEWTSCGQPVGDFSASMKTTRMSKPLAAKFKSTQTTVTAATTNQPEKAFEWPQCELGHFGLVKNWIYNMEVTKDNRPGEKAVVAQ